MNQLYLVCCTFWSLDTHSSMYLVSLAVPGSGGLLERLKGTGVDVIGLDWTLDVSDARGRLGKDIPVQVYLEVLTWQHLLCTSLMLASLCFALCS